MTKTAVKVRNTQQCHQTYEVLDTETLTSLLRVYRESFAEARATCAQNQMCYTPSQFLKALKDVNYLKVIMVIDGDPIGFALLTNSMTRAKITYMNPQRFANLYPEAVKQNRLWYCTALAILPDWRGQGMSYPMFLSVAKHLREQDAILAFDYAEDKPDFKEYIMSMFDRAQRELSGRKNRPMICLEVGRQTYATVDFAQSA